MASSTTLPTTLTYADVFRGEQVCIKSHCKLSRAMHLIFTDGHYQFEPCGSYFTQMPNPRTLHHKSGPRKPLPTSNLARPRGTTLLASSYTLQLVNVCRRGIISSRIYIADEDRNISEVSASACTNHV